MDPDAPNPTEPTMREYLHWYQNNLARSFELVNIYNDGLLNSRMVTDIPESTTVEFGNVIIPYESPQPSIGIHRMIFILFRQPSRRMTRSVTNQRRCNFNTRDFAEMYNLGLPASVVYFNCQRERGSGFRRFKSTS